MTTQVNVSHCLCFERYYSTNNCCNSSNKKCPYLSKRRDGIDQGCKGEDIKFPIVEYYNNKKELKKLRKKVKKLEKKYAKLKNKYKNVKHSKAICEEENIDLEIIEPPTPCSIKTVVLDDCKKSKVDVTETPKQNEEINEELYYDKNFAAMEEDEPEIESVQLEVKEEVEAEEEVETEEEEVVEEEEEEVETEEEEVVEEEEEVVEEEVETEEEEVVEEEEVETEEEVEEEEEVETEEEVEEEEEEVETEEEVEEEEEEEEEVETEEEEVVEEEEEEEEVEEVEEEVETEEEEVEEEVETEEEEEEVELFTYRKKKYWATNTENGVLYEITSDEDIGDEVGKIINGKVKLYKK